MFDVEDHGQAAYAAVVRAELARRLPAASVRVFAPFGPDNPTRSDRGEPAESLGAWSRDRGAQLAEQLDSVLIGGDHLVADDDEWAARYRTHSAHVAQRRPGRFFVDPVGLAARWHVFDAGGEAALRGAGVEGPIDVTPHPAVLLDRLLPPAVLAKRLQYLRLMGWYPKQAPALVVQGPSDVAAALALLGRVLDDRPGATPVLVELGDGDAAGAAALAGALAERGRPFHRLPAWACLEDVVAAIASAGGFVGSAPAGCMAAGAYSTPWAALGADTSPAALNTGGDDRRRLQDEVDGWLDRVAAGAAAAAWDRHPEGMLPAPDRTAVDSELRALRLAHRARGERASAARVVLADRLARAEAEMEALKPEIDGLRARLEAETEARARAEAEIAALHATRTFRWTASARDVYRKAGGPRR